MSRPGYRWQTVLKPTEHGGWALLAEPLLIGLLVQPSWRGAAVAVAAVLFFLSRQPLRLGLSDILRHKRYPRTIFALASGGGLAAVATAMAVAATFESKVALMCLAFFSLLALAQFQADVRGIGRALWPELAGAAAMAWFAPAIAAVQGLSPAGAALLWVLVVAHSVPSLLYVRERLNRAKGATPNSRAAIFLHALPLAALVALVPQGFSPLLAAGSGVLLARCLCGLSVFARPLRPAMVGAGESGYALLWVAVVAFGV